MAVVYENDKKANALAKKLGVKVAKIEERDGGEYLTIHFDNGYFVRGYSFDLFVFNPGRVVRLIRQSMTEWLATQPNADNSRA